MSKPYRIKAWEFIKRLVLINLVVDLMTKKSRKRIEHWLDSGPIEIDVIANQLVKKLKAVKSVSRYVAKDELKEDFFFKEILVIEVRFAHFILLQKQDEVPQLLRVNGKGVNLCGERLHLAKWTKKKNAIQLYFFHLEKTEMKDQVLQPI